LIARTEENRNDPAEKACASVRRSGRRYHDYRSKKKWVLASCVWEERRGVLPLMPSLSKDDGEAADRRPGKRNGQLTPRA